MKYVYGIDIGGTNIKIGLFNLSNTILLHTREIPTPKNNHDYTIFNLISKEISRINDVMNILYQDVLGVGIAIPCPVKDGYVFHCANLKWQQLDVINSFRKYIPEHVTVIIANDANLAAYGENKSLETPFSNVVFYTMGTGIGGGIIINNELIEGSLGMAGEVGHMPISSEISESCGCGAIGCLEQICGTKAMIEYTKELLKSQESILENVEYLTIKDIFDAAKLGDKLALNVVDRVSEHMGLSASILAAVLDPQVFIIGGGISNAGEFLLEKIVLHYKKFARFNTGSIPFILAKTGNSAGMLGAAHLVSDKIK
jgi:glucokinase